MVASDLKYLGPIDLTMYFVMDFSIQEVIPTGPESQSDIL